MHKRNKLITIVLLAFALLVVTSGSAWYFYNMIQDEQSSPELATVQKSNLSDLRSASQQDFVASYSTAFSESYSAAYTSIKESPPAQWDEEDVVQAYFIIEYAIKSGPPNIIIEVLGMLEEAGKAGVDINVNDLGYTNEYRTGLFELYSQSAQNLNSYPSDVSEVDGR